MELKSHVLGRIPAVDPEGSKRPLNLRRLGVGTSRFRGRFRGRTPLKLGNLRQEVPLHLLNLPDNGQFQRAWTLLLPLGPVSAFAVVAELTYDTLRDLGVLQVIDGAPDKRGLVFSKGDPPLLSLFNGSSRISVEPQLTSSTL